MEVEDRGHKVKIRCRCKRNSSDSRVVGDGLLDNPTGGLRLQLVPAFGVRKRLNDEIVAQDGHVKLNWVEGSKQG